MTTREKLIKALNMAEVDLRDMTIRMTVQFRDEIVRQMSPKPIEIEGGETTWWYVCPECHGAVDNGDHFCRHCGQAIK
ncbi:MAG: hypothetical protein J6S83_03345 [Lachnospiraceae bacterium]|nr:hypothetical protein [Lachnospiraceae bacterium]